MATSTVTEVREVPEVEVTDNVATEQSEPVEDNSGFAKLRRRFKKDNSSKRPSDDKWRQQQIPACRPVFSAKHVCFGFCVIGLVFIALGIAFTVILSNLREIEVEYTQCSPTSSSISDHFDSCADYVICKRDCFNVTTDTNCLDFLNVSGINQTTSCQQLPTCQCQVDLTLNQPLRPTVHVYYGIKNYYQNHRRYLNSLDVQQIHGDINRDPTEDCRPLIRDGNNPIVPCGLIANSWFNDSIDVIRNTENGDVFDINRNNIAWESDRNTRFNDSTSFPVPQKLNNNSVSPPNWPAGILDVPGGLKNESLIVWFRVSAFPWFRKLYGRLNGTMPSSNYTVTITYSYPVTDFNGGKSIILAEVSWLGGRNLFLGSIYIIVGVFLIIAGIVLLLIHLFCSKWKETDKNFLKRSH